MELFIGFKLAHLLMHLPTYCLQTIISFFFFRANTMETMVVKALLTDYEKLSGQFVNFQKFRVFNSVNVLQSQRDALSVILGVSNNLSDGKYLGLPFVVGR